MYGVVAGWSQSGQSQQAYCATQGLSMAVFQYWLRHWRESQVEQGEGEFVEVRPQTRGEGLIVEYPNGIKVHLPRDYSEHQLRVLLKLIEG
jgi:hypothetical protein